MRKQSEVVWCKIKKQMFQNLGRSIVHSFKQLTNLTAKVKFMIKIMIMNQILIVWIIIITVAMLDSLQWEKIVKKVKLNLTMGYMKREENSNYIKRKPKKFNIKKLDWGAKQLRVISI